MSYPSSATVSAPTEDAADAALDAIVAGHTSLSPGRREHYGGPDPVSLADGGNVLVELGGDTVVCQCANGPSRPRYAARASSALLP